MVDRVSRDQLAKAIRRLAAGLITNDAFEDSTRSCRRSLDTAVRSLRRMAWTLYSDHRAYRLEGRDRLRKTDRREIARWIVFLKSNVEYEWPDLTGWTWLLLAFPNLLTFGAIGRLVRRWHDQRGDVDAWPFIRGQDLKRAASVWPADCRPQAEVTTSLVRRPSVR
jgi:hypothetical protein